MSKHLPIVMLAMLMIITLWGAEAPVGAWKVNPARSTWTGDPRLKSLIVRFQGHPHGEVFTQERIEADGRTATVSTILYFDGEPRDFQGFGCLGSQLSRRVDSQSVEILRICGGGNWTRFIRHWGVPAKELILDITEHSAGRRTERHLVLEKQ